MHKILNLSFKQWKYFYVLRNYEEKNSRNVKYDPQSLVDKVDHGTLLPCGSKKASTLQLGNFQINLYL